jgi:glucose/arabinose dehydrogenase
MRCRSWFAAACCAAIVFGLARPAAAQGPIPGSIPVGPYKIEVLPAATGLVAPNFMAAPPGDTSRKFIVDQPGTIRIINNGVLDPTPFLDIRSAAPVVADRRVIGLSAAYDERGLLGMAFDPDFNNAAKPGFRRVFTYTSEAAGVTPGDYPLPPGANNTTINHQSVIASWKVSAANPNLVDTSTRQELLRFDQPQSNHNGGDLAFGPDGFLYVASGDGGDANDNNPNGHTAVTGNGQNTNVVLGKILRLDVNGNNGKRPTYGIPAANPFSASGGAKEVFAYGFRNPFRFSFSGNDLYVADVGQNTIEEVDKVVAGKNYGWNYKEGKFFFNPANGTVSANPIPGATPGTPGAPVAVLPITEDPVLQYDRDDNGVVKRISIIGGYVYHGTKLPGMQGKYIFGDFSSAFNSPNGSLYYADLTTGEINQFILGDSNHPLGFFVKGIGEDANGELYVMGSTNLGPSGATGIVLAIVPEPGTLGVLALSSLFLARRTRRRA